MLSSFVLMIFFLTIQCIYCYSFQRFPGVRVSSSQLYAGRRSVKPVPQNLYNHSQSSGIKAIWEFSRPHTVIGSVISITSLFMYAKPSHVKLSPTNVIPFITHCLIPSITTNIFITGLNQLSDVKIDRINKPYLPIPGGSLSYANALGIVLLSYSLSILLIQHQSLAWKCTILTSLFLGYVYSIPPFRFKRYPILAALCISLVRGILINLGFFLQAKYLFTGESFGSLATVFAVYPSIFLVVCYFTLYAMVIATMKDASDVSGDVAYQVRTFSVQYGPQTVVRWGKNLLVGTCLTAVACIISSTLHVLLSSPLQQLPPLLPLFRLLVPCIVLSVFAWELHRRYATVNFESSQSIYDYYMFIWQLFYLSYLLLPFLK